jgi:hypothetical protein
MYLSLLGIVFTFTAQGVQIFYLFNGIFPMFQVLTHTTMLAMQNLSKVKIVSDTN